MSDMLSHTRLAGEQHECRLIPEKTNQHICKVPAHRQGPEVLSPRDMLIGSHHLEDVPVTIIAIWMTLVEIDIFEGKARHIVHQQVMGSITPAQ